MTDDEKKLLINMFGLDSRVDAGVPQQNGPLLYPEEINPVISSEHKIDKKYYIKRDDRDFSRQSNLQHRAPLEEILPWLFNIGISAHTVGEFLEKIYGNASEKEGPMSKKLFIASSYEGLEYATALQRLLSEHFVAHDLNIACVRWNDRGVFRNGESTLANLERIADELYAKGDTNKMGYAACVLTPDEIVKMREETYCVARDNVIFEYGLFLGKLGHARTFLLVPPKKLGDSLPKFHTLTDLDGITAQAYPSYDKDAKSTQVGEMLVHVAEDIFYDIFETEKKLSPPVPSDNARLPTPTNSSSSNAALKVGDYVGDRTESGRSLTKY